MRYGHPVHGYIVDVVDVPSPLPNWAIDDATFLAKLFPNINGWVVLTSNLGNGAIDQGEGNYVQPSITMPAVYKMLSWAECNTYLIGLLGGGDIGTAALQTILETANTHAGSLTADKLIRHFYTWFVGSTSFSREDMAVKLGYLVPAVITAGQATAVANSWPRAQ